MGGPEVRAEETSALYHLHVESKTVGLVEPEIQMVTTRVRVEGVGTEEMLV